MCSAPAFCAWRRLPLISLKLLVGVCVYETVLLSCTLAASVCVGRTFAASVKLLPRGWRAVTFPRWLHVQSCSTWLILSIFGCCFGGLRVRDGLASAVCAHISRTSILLPLSCFLGAGAQLLSLGGSIF